MARDFPDRWAVFRASALGDVTLTTGVLDWWHRTQGLRFTFITRSALAPILAGHPAVDEVIPVALDEIDGHDWWRKARRIATDCSGMGFLDLHRSLRSMALNLHWDGHTRDYPKFGMTRRLYRHFSFGYLERRLSALNVPQRYALALDATPPPVEELRPVIYLSEAETQAARTHLSHIGLTKPFVALHPFATHPDKAWPMGYWLSLIPLIERAGLDWIIIGKNPDHLEALDDPRNLTGRTSLRETCALIAQAKALVTADSGPMHLGTAVGTPVVALFGPTSRAWGFYPSGRYDTVLEQPLQCRPCSLHGSTACKRGRECLTSIEPDEVAARLFHTLERAAGSTVTAL
ncbi:MAG: glycosyltransferase family 9 protein [Humidesulfovibrio sp.]|uniref:glycosyltransferase family 9 protein n=1 Tax=Humidesulfovibrio sp. TaxID=2910988 RepID=UPI0027FD03F4|nr:glycosyltransferase family 9 protein [Humidesulfovibrio sp.]MDQ7834682.1 glycosyltransferase family 9 protein [Humidesulfovibrio sp.]